MAVRPDVDWTTQLFDAQGCRKYLSGGERRRFLAAAARTEPRTRALCRLLALTGCRISEALELTPARLDRETGRVIFRSLKRRKLVYRAVPIPPQLMSELRALARGLRHDERIWCWCRQTGWHRIKDVMRRARIRGAQAMPKGLRHAFGICNAEADIPLAITSRWLGHSRLSTTAIYVNAVGREERAFAKRLWRDLVLPTSLS